jgi:hypothetical protein
MYNTHDVSKEASTVSMFLCLPYYWDVHVRCNGDVFPCIRDLDTRTRPVLNFRPLRLYPQVNLPTLSKLLFLRLGKLQGQSERYERDTNI